MPSQKLGREDDLAGLLDTVSTSTIRRARTVQKLLTTAEPYVLHPTSSSPPCPGSLLAFEGQYDPDIGAAPSRLGAGR